MSKIENFADTFNQAVLAPQWYPFTAGDATLSFDSTGASMIYPQSTSTSSTDGDISAKSTYDFTESYVYFQVLSLPHPTTNADAELRLQFYANNYICWFFVML